LPLTELYATSKFVLVWTQTGTELCMCERERDRLNMVISKRKEYIKAATDKLLRTCVTKSGR
jgi:hypothetical protein